MNLLQVYKAHKQYGEKVLFADAKLSVNDDEHIGVIGPNGAGKTTLFKALVGTEQLDSGEIIKSNSLRIGYLEQESDWNINIICEDYLTQNCSMPIWEIKQIGLSIGLTEDHFKSKLESLSGGYRMRVKLLYLIGNEPNLMLLDEPTNFLDLESILALEKFLQGYKGAFMMISHDREFLRRTTDHTLEIEGGEITKFPGNIDDYFEQKQQLRQIMEAQASNLEAKRKHLESFVERFRAKATKAKQAQSRMKQLEKMESIEIKALPIRARIKIPQPTHTGKEILHLTNAILGYHSKPILKSVNISLNQGDRVGVVGFNGAGKSTLLKSLSSRIPLLSGDLKLGHQVRLSYFAQHVTEDLNAEDTVLQSLQSAASKDILGQEILNMAGSLLFSGDDVNKKIKVLSGGEKSRVALGQMLLQKSPLLIMDEPTNHLDFETVEALTDALCNYEGTLIIVSHDRGFIRRVSNKILEIHDGKAEVYPGTYDEYVWSLEKGALSERASLTRQDSVAKVNINIESTKFNYKDETKRIQSEIKELNRKILKSEEILNKKSNQRDQINLDLINSSGLRAQELSKNLSDISKEIEATEEIILQHMEDMQTKETELESLRSKT